MQDGLSYLTEDQPLSIGELIATPSEAMKNTHTLRPSLGFNSKAFWFFVTLKNTGTQESSVIFEVAYPRLELLDFYAVDAEGRIRAHYTTGTEFPRATRPINHLYFAFPLTVPPDSSLRIFIKTKTDSPVRFPVKLWDPEEFREAQQDNLTLQGLYFGGIGIMVIYNMFVFFSTRSVSYLYYSLFVVFAGLYLGGEAGLLLRYVFTQSAFFNNRLLLIAIIGANVSGLLFVNSFLILKIKDPVIHRIICVLAPAWLLSLIFVFSLPYHILGISYTLISTCSTLLLLTATVRGILRRQREAYFYAAAWITFLFGTVAFALLSLGFLPANFFTEKAIQIGSLFEVTILSLALADRLNQLRVGLKHANDQLAYQIEHVEEQVLVKTRDIRSIMEHIPMGVFYVQSDQTIHKDYSKSMENLFMDKQFAGRNAIDIIFGRTDLSGDRKEQVRAALMHSIGDDVLNFQINQHFFVDHIVVDVQGEKRTYSLSWNPVCKDNRELEKVLVTVHDSTDLLTLEREAEAQRQEIASIQKILDIPASRFQSFLRQADQLLTECRSILDNLPKTKGDLQILSMNVHTLKGTARSLYFDEISDLCHGLEDRLKGGNPAEQAEDLNKLDECLLRYKRIAVEKLGRNLDRGTTVELKIQDIKGLIKDLNAGTRANLRALEMSLYRPLDELLTQSLQSAKRLASDLGKAPPDIAIDTADFGITEDAYDTLSGLLIHLVRNSLDHGLEESEQRIKLGKNPAGRIHAEAFSEAGQCCIDFYDDGRGLDMVRLANKQHELGWLNSQAGPQDIAELIFVAEVSTRDTVSSVSGRGLGLSAVRESLRREGGDVKVILMKEKGDFIDFRLRLVLPAHFWIHFHPLSLAQSA